MTQKLSAARLSLALIASLLFTSFKFQPARTAAQNPQPEGPALIMGEFEYSNDFVVETYYVEHAVALLDMTGFVLRDKEWELPVESQVLGYMQLDAENNRASFRLALPLLPEGQFNDVNQDGKTDRGVQIFALGYSPNLTGGVFSQGDDRSLGWPAYLASVKTDTENQDEVLGGKLVIWAPDGAQQFPNGFGPDGLLFTADDPQMSVRAGYSIVDLDATPFRLIREREVEILLYEPSDIAVKDFSGLSYTEAFDEMFAIASREYAFNGVAGKEPDWQALYTELAPRVQEAQATNDAYYFYLTLRDFTLAFEDGHVGLSGGQQEARFNETTILGGFGFAVRELDDGSLVTVFVTPDGPAEKARMRVGAEILSINGQDVQSALEAEPQFTPQSTEFGARYEKSMMLTRGTIGEEMTVKFRNPSDRLENSSESCFLQNLLRSIQNTLSGWFSAGGKTISARLLAEYELESLFAVYYGGETNEFALPVEYSYDPTAAIGTIRINSNYDDLGLAIRIFARALGTFEEAGALGIVIDMRQNLGGAPLGLAGFLHDEDILLGQLEYYSDRTGKFEADGPRDKVYPNENQYRFDYILLLVDQFCYSACEIEAFGFSQVPGMLVMGQFPSAGVEAETARGSFKMPEGISLTIPTGRFTLPDGGIFLEGEGVQLDVRLPVDRESALSTKDVVLQAAYEYILSQQ